jgi:hypothetical protein
MLISHTDEKENKIFLIYKEIQNGAVAKSYMTNGLLIYVLGRPSSYMTLQLLHTEFPLYEENLFFFFISVLRHYPPHTLKRKYVCQFL